MNRSQTEEEKSAMEIDEEIKALARQLVSMGAQLPTQLPGSSHIFLHEIGDERFAPITAIIEGGREYGIGLKKE